MQVTSSSAGWSRSDNSRPARAPCRRMSRKCGWRPSRRVTGSFPAGRLHVKFRSPRTLEQLESDRGASSGCGDEKIEPLPGDRIRLYVLLDQSYEYVADHPQGFFYVTRSEPLLQSNRRSWWLSAESLAGLGVGLLVGAALRGRAAGRGRNHRPIVDAGTKPEEPRQPASSSGPPSGWTMISRGDGTRRAAGGSIPVDVRSPDGGSG